MKTPNQIVKLSKRGHQTRLRLYENAEQLLQRELQASIGEDPFYIVSMDAILNQHRRWLQNMPRVQPFYAVKCNTTPLVLQTLASLGCNFDCASKAEIDTVMQLGVPAERIIYANPCKTRSFIKHAEQVGVDLMTFDNEDELHKVARTFPNARLVLRIKVDDSQSVCKFSAKFGASVPDALSLLEMAKKLNLNVVGVSFHVGSGCESVDSFVNAIKDAKIVFTYGQNLNFNMQLLDLGGGFPGTSDAKITFEEIAEAIGQTLDKVFPPTLAEGLRIIAEPGRYYAASAFTLVTQVIAKRELNYEAQEIAANMQQVQDSGLIRCPARNLDQMNKSDAVGDEKAQVDDSCVDYRRGMMYYLNDGVYGSFNCTIFDHWTVHPEPYYAAVGKGGPTCSQLDAQSYVQTVLWGPTCDSMDMIRKSIFLPELDVGDFIVFREMGAYTIAAASTFNGFALPSMKFQLNVRLWPHSKVLPIGRH